MDLVNRVTNCLRHISVAAKNFCEHLCHTFSLKADIRATMLLYLIGVIFELMPVPLICSYVRLFV